MRKLILALLFALTLAAAARATPVTVGATTTPWRYGTSPTAYLLVYANSGFTPANGAVGYVRAGARGSGNYYLAVAGTVSSGTLTIPSFQIESTDDSADNSKATYTFVLADDKKNEREVFAANVVLTITYGASVTWDQLRIFNAQHQGPPPVGVYDARQVDAIYQGHLFSNPATPTSRGVGKSSMNVADPVFVERTDPRVAAASTTNRGTVTTTTATSQAVSADDLRLPASPAFVWADRFVSLTAALSYCASTYPAGATLVISTDITQAGDISIPSTVALFFTNAGRLSVVSGTTFIRGGVAAPPQRIFFPSGSGAVSFSSAPQSDLLLSEWFGGEAAALVAAATATPALPVGVVGSNDPRVAQKSVAGTDNAAVDSAAIQAALTALATSGGTLRTRGICSLNSTVISYIAGLAPTSAINLEVDGSWRLATTLTLPNRVNWIGLGGASNLQFQYAGPTAGIIPPSGNIPTLKLHGSNDHLVKNLAISGNQGVGILLDGASQLTALVRLENVAVQPAQVSTGIPLVSDAVFWVFMDNVSLLAPSSAPYVMRLTLSSSAFGGTYLIDVRNLFTSDRAVQIDSQISTAGFGQIAFKNWTYEGGLEEMLRVDATNVQSNAAHSGILLDGLTVADATHVPSVVKSIAPGPGRVRNVTFLNSDLGNTIPLLSGPVDNVIVEGGRSFFYTTGWSIGSQRQFNVQTGGAIDAEDVTRAGVFSPSVAPATSLAVIQDASTWGSQSGSATVTQVLGPDGTMNAGLLTTASGQQSRTVYNNGSLILSVGDYILFGAWVRSNDLAQPPSTASNIFSGHATFDGSTLEGEMSNRYGALQWHFVTALAKVRTVDASPAGVSLSLACDSTHPTAYARPFLMQLKASDGWTDDEAYRLKRQTGNVASGIPAGSVGMFPDQTLYAGRLVSQVQTTFADGAATPSVAAGNDFKTANTGATTITDFTNGVNGQEIFIVVDANTTIQNNSAIKTRSGSNFAGAANVTCTFKRFGGVWYQKN